MKTVGFEIRLYKPRHPFTKGKVERLIRFVKESFPVYRVFISVTNLNWQVLECSNCQDGIYHNTIGGVPQHLHLILCGERLKKLPKTDAVKFYLCSERKISFDGFVNYEVRQFGAPYSYTDATARVTRSGDMLYICSFDLRMLLPPHDVTWSHNGSFCVRQYGELTKPEEFPTAPVNTQIRQLPKPATDLCLCQIQL